MELLLKVQRSMPMLNFEVCTCGVQKPIRDTPVSRVAAVYENSCRLNLGNKGSGLIIVDSRVDKRSVYVADRVMQSGEKVRRWMIDCAVRQAG